MAFEPDTAVTMIPDRRRHRRFDVDLLPSQLWVIERHAAGARLRPCRLINISYSGICFLTDAPVRMRGAYDLLINMPAPFGQVAIARARLIWLRPAEGEDKAAGAEFVRSTTGWLGPEDERQPSKDHWRSTSGPARAPRESRERAQAVCGRCGRPLERRVLSTRPKC